jgi:hypothetical protein
MSKLIAAATAALAALAVMAVAAVPAYATVTITEPDGVTPCPETEFGCFDEGYVGEFDYRNSTLTAKGSCEAEFNLWVRPSGVFQTQGQSTVCESDPGYQFNVRECDGSPPWQGQIGAFGETTFAHMGICLQAGEGSPIEVPVTFLITTPESGLRTWTQLKKEKKYSIEIIENALFEDTFAEDNFGVLVE